MASNYSWYPGFQKWWADNVTAFIQTNPQRAQANAAYGRNIFNNYIARTDENARQAAAQKAADKKQNEGALLAAGGAIGAPVAKYIGESITDAFRSAPAEEVAKGAAETASAALSPAGGVSASGGPSGAADLLSGNIPDFSYAPGAEQAATGGTSGLGEMANLATNTTGELGSWWERPGQTLGDTLGLQGNYATAADIAQGAAGAYGLYDVFANERKGARGGLQAGTSAFALANSFALPPQISIPIALAAAAAGFFNRFGDKDRWKEEYDRKKKLRDQGLISDAELGPAPTRGRSKQELLVPGQAADFKGLTPEGQWVNNKFSQSRNESDLAGRDIALYSTPYELLGKAYADASLDKKIAYGDELLKQNLVREARGQIQYTDPNKAKSIWEQMAGA